MGKISEISDWLKNNKQAENIPDFKALKDEIIAEINEQCKLLGLHSDINFKANNENWVVTDENITKILNVVSRIRKQQRETAEQQSENNTEPLEIHSKGSQEYFNFWLFKLRKSSLVIAMLGLLVFVLTVFCMKQQNDYALLNQECYKQNILIREMQAEVDSLRNNIELAYKQRKNSEELCNTQF